MKSMRGETLSAKGGESASVRCVSTVAMQMVEIARGVGPGGSNLMR